MIAPRLFLFSVFFLSGIAGIIYQILWMREIQILFGNTAQSAAIVLLVFFLGMQEHKGFPLFWQGLGDFIFLAGRWDCLYGLIARHVI